MWVEEGNTEHELDNMISNWCSNEYLLFIQTNKQTNNSFDRGNWEICLQLRIAHTEHDFK